MINFDKSRQTFFFERISDNDEKEKLCAITDTQHSYLRNRIAGIHGLVERELRAVRLAARGDGLVRQAVVEAAGGEAEQLRDGQHGLLVHDGGLVPACRESRKG